MYVYFGDVRSILFHRFLEFFCIWVFYQDLVVAKNFTDYEEHERCGKTGKILQMKTGIDY